MTKVEKFDAQRVSAALREIWCLLTEEQQNCFLSVLRVERYKKHEMLYREGDMAEDLLCLMSGKVKIYRDGYSGRSLINRVLRPVQYFGYRASMANEPYVTAASALEECVIVSIPMREVYKVMEQNPRLCLFFLRELATDLGEADKRIVGITQKHVRGRLAETLLKLQDIYGFEEDGCTLAACISREDMANLSNMTTANAIRTLSDFHEEGLLEVKGRVIKYLDFPALQAISNNG